MNKNTSDIRQKEQNEKIKKLKIEFEKLENEKDYVLYRRDLKTNQKPKLNYVTPYRVHLEKDKAYFYCTCGESKLQPFCDGSHKHTEFKPLKFSIKQEVTWSLLCGCKYNAETSGPFCDGNHVKLEW